MLNPARARENLLMLQLVRSCDFSPSVKEPQRVLVVP